MLVRSSGLSNRNCRGSTNIFESSLLGGGGGFDPDDTTTNNDDDDGDEVSLMPQSGSNHEKRKSGAGAPQASSSARPGLGALRSMSCRNLMLGRSSSHDKELSNLGSGLSQTNHEPRSTRPSLGAGLRSLSSRNLMSRYNLGGGGDVPDDESSKADSAGGIMMAGLNRGGALFRSMSGAARNHHQSNSFQTIEDESTRREEDDDENSFAADVPAPAAPENTTTNKKGNSEQAGVVPAALLPSSRPAAAALLRRTSLRSTKSCRNLRFGEQRQQRREGSVSPNSMNNKDQQRQQEQRLSPPSSPPSTFLRRSKSSDDIVVVPHCQQPAGGARPRRQRVPPKRSKSAHNVKSRVPPALPPPSRSGNHHTNNKRRSRSLVEKTDKSGKNFDPLGAASEHHTSSTVKATTAGRDGQRHSGHSSNVRFPGKVGGNRRGGDNGGDNDGEECASLWLPPTAARPGLGRSKSCRVSSGSSSGGFQRRVSDGGEWLSCVQETTADNNSESSALVEKPTLARAIMMKRSNSWGSLSASHPDEDGDCPEATGNLLGDDEDLSSSETTDGEENYGIEVDIEWREKSKSKNQGGYLQLNFCVVPEQQVRPAAMVA